MKRIVEIFIMTCMILLYTTSSITYTGSVGFDSNTLLEQERIILIKFLFVIIIILIAISFLLYKKIRVLKNQNKQANYYNELKQAYIDTSHDIVFLKDENLRYIFINKNFEKFNNRESSEIIGYDDFDLLEQEVANRYRKNDLQVLEKKALTVNELRFGDKVLRTTKFPVKLLNDNYGIGAYVEDVTEEHSNKRKLEQINLMISKSNNLLSAILESSPEVNVFALDTNYCYLSFNSKHKEIMKELWGQDIEIGMNMLEIISNQDDYIKSKENFDRAIAGESFKLIKEYGSKTYTRTIWQYYYSPMYSDDRVIGLTCFVLNITDRIEAEEKIAYLSYHDSLTGLYNRRFFEEELTRLDVERNLPISIIVGDVNGLKLINDIFGHADGNLLLKKVAEVCKKVCRADDIIARMGGDEFTILLPKTKEQDAEEIISRIKEQFSKESVKSIKGNISMGYATKTNVGEEILHTLEIAENKMYSVKTLDRNDVKSTTLKTIIKTLHLNSNKEAKHSENVSKICEKIGKVMNLPEVEIRRLKEAGFLHDIGKIVIDESILNDNEKLTDKVLEKVKQHPMVGYRILNSIDETLDLAESILAHHERWDGMGYPKGLKGEEIPKLARIIAVADYYDTIVNRSNHNSMSKEDAINDIKKQIGSKFDPEVVKAFSKVTA